MLEKRINTVVDWLKDQVRKAGAEGLIVGVSGGIDSAVAAFLIKKAFPSSSLGVILPCESASQDMADAREVVKKADLAHLEIDLTPTFKTLAQAAKQAVTSAGGWNDRKERAVLANLKARLRMSTLYLLAQNYNYLVVGTDNKAEWYLGYFTKFGDGGADLLPLVHLTKGEVRQWAAHLGVPEQVIQKAPSAGLWPGQTDEEEMGVTYLAVDRYLQGEPVSEQERTIIERWHNQTAHKRQLPLQPPPFD